MDQHNVVLFGHGGKLLQLFQHLVVVIVGVLALGDKEAEHADVAAVQHLADLAQGIQLGQLFLKAFLVLDANLTDGATQAGHLHAGRLQTGQQALFGLLHGVVGNALAVGRTQRNMIHSQSGDNLQLLVQLRIDLIGKTRNHNLVVHFSISSRFSHLHKNANRALCMLYTFTVFCAQTTPFFVYITHSIIIFCNLHC